MLRSESPYRQHETSSSQEVITERDSLAAWIFIKEIIASVISDYREHNQNKPDFEQLFQQVIILINCELSQPFTELNTGTVDALRKYLKSDINAVIKRKAILKKLYDEWEASLNSPRNLSQSTHQLVFETTPDS